MLRKNPLAIVFFTIFIDMLGYGILIPIIPLLLANPQSEYFLLPAGYSLKQGYILLGFLTATFPLMQFLATPILGQLSDRFGRRKILAISLAGTCISYILFAVGIIIRNIPLLFFARAFDGITGGNIAVAQAALADITKPEHRAKTFGMMGAAFGMGFILGPYIGGKLSDPHLVSWFHAVTPFWFAAILSGLNVLSVIFFFPETRAVLTAGAIRWGQSIRNIIRAFNLPKLRLLYTTVFLFQGGFGFFTTFFSVFLIVRFSFDQGDIGDFFAYVGLWVAITQALVTRRLSRIWREPQILRISLFATGVAVLLYFIPHTWTGLLLVTPLFAIANGLSQANLLGLVSRTADQSIQGEILGINASVQAFAQSIPPILSGYIAAGLNPNAPTVVATIIICFAGLLFIVGYRSRQVAT